MKKRAKGFSKKDVIKIRGMTVVVSTKSGKEYGGKLVKVRTNNIVVQSDKKKVRIPYPKVWCIHLPEYKTEKRKRKKR